MKEDTELPQTDMDKNNSTNERDVLIATEKEPLIKIRNLNHYFGKADNEKQVLFDIDLDIYPGELVIMTGPSGSGKTTLLTLIGALRSVQEGSLQAMGKELKGLGKNEFVKYRRSLGFIFQMHNLFESLTAYQNVKMALETCGKISKEKEKKISETLIYLGLEERINYKPNSLSGGQRQRVAIARALVNRPKLILADEPTAALDKESGQDVIKLLKKMAKEEMCTTLMVTHDNRVLHAADRIINMVDGCISSDIIVDISIMISEYLRKCKVFSSLPPSNLMEVAKNMTKEQYNAGSTIMRQGEEGDKYYMIVDGIVEVFEDKEDGPKMVRTLEKGQSFGEKALIADTPRSATCIAKTDCICYSLGNAAFKHALDKSAPFVQQLLRAIANR